MLADLQTRVKVGHQMLGPDAAVKPPQNTKDRKGAQLGRGRDGRDLWNTGSQGDRKRTREESPFFAGVEKHSHFAMRNGGRV